MLLLDQGQMTAQGGPAEVLGSPACARAFGVVVHGHPVPGLSSRLYHFQEPGEV
jgi:ABC-type cobalamin transport system ATPase subunit